MPPHPFDNPHAACDRAVDALTDQLDSTQGTVTQLVNERDRLAGLLDEATAALRQIGKQDATATRCTICRARGDVRTALVGRGAGPTVIAHEPWCPTGIARDVLGRIDRETGK